MRLVVLALLVVGCNGCQAPQPPTGPTNPPPPVHADAGSPCAAACDAAQQRCPKAVIDAYECTVRCTEGMRQLTGNSPACLAGTLTCSDKGGCP